jgi:hypothetical protein
MWGGVDNPSINCMTGGVQAPAATSIVGLVLAAQTMGWLQPILTYWFGGGDWEGELV